MFTITKSFEFSASHQLKLDYESPCRERHGHNWRVTVMITGKCLLKGTGMIFDFMKIKQPIMERFDHKDVNKALLIYCQEIPPDSLCAERLRNAECNPTAEILAFVIGDIVNRILKRQSCSKHPAYVCNVTVEESQNNLASWRPDYAEE